ncbi:BrnT family toxin [Persicirhabdus sediminis]|uniref:BrnT family toxin n=1 Tax=Persicirhabdus sediminis TaxID=454144 RepID=A0A8J7SHY7_9BACT|nr:BrnT family toxin [Persicirhabdus sediminis]MBK1791100.1 BrnT family toxin [Persicirhabdus sediminis]
MELDLTYATFDLKFITPGEIEEVMEDPFALKFLPDHERADGEVRYYMIGRSITGRDLFICFWTNGKEAKVYAAREMSSSEANFYQRKYAEFK